MLAGTFGLIELGKKFDDSIDDPIDDESAHAFDDWFKDAAKGAEDTSDDGEAPAGKDPEIAVEAEEVSA